jgi:hypothetical protein
VGQKWQEFVATAEKGEKAMFCGAERVSASAELEEGSVTKSRSMVNILSSGLLAERVRKSRTSPDESALLFQKTRHRRNGRRSSGPPHQF